MNTLLLKQGYCYALDFILSKIVNDRSFVEQKILEDDSKGVLWLLSGEQSISPSNYVNPYHGVYSQQYAPGFIAQGTMQYTPGTSFGYKVAV